MSEYNELLESAVWINVRSFSSRKNEGSYTREVKEMSGNLAEVATKIIAANGEPDVGLFKTIVESLESGTVCHFPKGNIDIRMTRL